MWQVVAIALAACNASEVSLQLLAMWPMCGVECWACWSVVVCWTVGGG